MNLLSVIKCNLSTVPSWAVHDVLLILICTVSKFTSLDLNSKVF